MALANEQYYRAGHINSIFSILDWPHTNYETEVRPWICIPGKIFVATPLIPWLVVFRQPLWKMMELLVNGKDDIPYMKWTIKNVLNHQPDDNLIWASCNPVTWAAHLIHVTLMSHGLISLHQYHSDNITINTHRETLIHCTYLHIHTNTLIDESDLAAKPQGTNSCSTWGPWFDMLRSLRCLMAQLRHGRWTNVSILAWKLLSSWELEWLPYSVYNNHIIIVY